MPYAPTWEDLQGLEMSDLAALTWEELAGEANVEKNGGVESGFPQPVTRGFSSTETSVSR